MATTYEKIATTTLGSATATITLSSIPATYTDIRLVFVFKTSVGGVQAQLSINGAPGGTAYSQTILYGDGSSVGSYRRTSASSILPDVYGGSTTIPHMVTYDIFSYAGSTYKTLLTDTAGDNNGSGETVRSVGLWSSTSAITSLVLTANSGTWLTGTTATLYGIKAA